MNIIYAECNIHHDSIDIATTAGYLLRIDCWEAEKGLRTTPCFATVYSDDRLVFTM